MKYNEKVERFTPKIGRKNLANGLSCPPFVYMDYSDDGMWVHYAKYCENIAKQKYKRCLAMAEMCNARYDEEDAKVNGHAASWEYISDEMRFWERWHERWQKLAEKFKE